LGRRRESLELATLPLMAVNNTLSDAPQPPNMATWIRISMAAKIARVAPDTLADWIERGEIPVAIRQHGPRLRFVNGPQFDTWNGTPNSLYTPDDLARAYRDHPPVNRANTDLDLF
jgi:hypothetical protein